MEWTTTPVGCWCGLCGRRLEPGTRVALMTTHKKIRCEVCVDLPLTQGRGHSQADDDLPLPVEPVLHPGCPYCGRILSVREHREQGACDECASGDVRLDGR